MRVEFCADDPDDARWQIDPLDYRLRVASGRNRRRNSHRRRGDATDAAFDTKIAVTVLRGRRRLAAKVAVADNQIWLGGGFGCGLRGDKTRDHSCERDCVSREERDYALPKWALHERPAHSRSPTPST